MLRKTLIAFAAAVSMAMLAPGDASARGGFGGGHGGFGHGGGFGGGFGGFHHGHGFGIGGFGLGVGLGYGLYGPYGYYGDYGYPYYAGYGDYDGGCYLVHRRVWTPHGWRFRRVEVCS